MYRRAASSIAQRAILQRFIPASPIASSSRIALSSTGLTQLQRRTFSNSFSRFSHGESDAALSSKLSSELSYERETADSSQLPAFLTEFRSSGVWTIDDKSGADEISLQRKFGNEDIKVLFSIADIDNGSTPSGEAGSADEEEEVESGLDTTEAGAAESQAESQSLPIRCAITISKGKSQGALTIDAVAQDGLFLVDNISLYPDETLALDLTSDADWKRRGLYMGPAFDHLDESLQTEFEAYLEERGIDSNLALFIPDLAEYKEQKEYTKWLEGVKRFVEV
ncbi:MAG: Mitochondrial acidic protein mam33 [Cyphobasidiales sp. Tagirdzhanova-0007]|nr:MAG: Mitochondrial acidic protein mam33 [Cyphobasidiales sp. Tagirdzhanova-0007]